MKQVNWKIVNAALWIEIILSYILPFQTSDNFAYKVGIPFPFLTVYDSPIDVNPLSSMYLNPAILGLNAVVLYFLLTYAIKLYRKVKDKRNDTV